MNPLSVSEGRRGDGRGGGPGAPWMWGAPRESCQHQSCTSVDRTSLVLVNNRSGRDRVGWEVVQGDHRIMEYFGMGEKRQRFSFRNGGARETGKICNT